MSLSEQFFGGDVTKTETVNGDSEAAAPAADAGSTPGLALRLVASATVIVLDVALVPQACDQNRPTGATFVAEADCPGGRIYICDPKTHTIDVLDRKGRPLFSFGGFGSRLGQLDTPTDVAVIRLDTADSSGETIDAGLLIVADQGNHRLQLFELDGVAIGEIGGHAGAWIPGRFPRPPARHSSGWGMSRRFRSLAPRVARAIPRCHVRGHGNPARSRGCPVTRLRHLDRGCVAS